VNIIIIFFVACVYSSTPRTRPCFNFGSSKSWCCRWPDQRRAWRYYR